MISNVKRLRMVSAGLAVTMLLTGLPATTYMPAPLAAVFELEEVEAATTILKGIDFDGLSPQQVIDKALPLAKAESDRTGILTSIILAQFILETGWGKSEVFRNANNGFGMSERVSGNSWAGSVWDGSSTYRKASDPSVSLRKYKSFNDSMRDYANYLLNAMDGSKKRYAGIDSTSSFEKSIDILVNGGYCPGSDYKSSLLSINERFNLVQYDKKETTQVTQKADATSSKGTVYVITASSGLRVRKGPGTSYARIGSYAKGTRVTVTEIKNGWGKVTYKGQTGWICLTYAKKA